ncbi:hypothetical protein HHI36_008188 [Cryptolaemus montrouzieri]|uniref:Uncharacterized protein n=1 Tax=Cryptolaemus montrouzieri TaxID=559131 RepID=A0ABD2MRU3_9CUCU
MPPSAADKIKQYRAFRQTASRRLKDINEIALNADVDENRRVQLKKRCLTVDLGYEEFGIQHNNMLQHISLQEDAEGMLAAEELVLQEADQSYYNIKATYHKQFEQDKEQSEVRFHYSNVRKPKLNIPTSLTTFSDNLSAMKNLKFPIEEWDFISFNLDTLKRFEFENNTDDLPHYSELYTFLERQCTALDSVALVKTPSKFSASHFKAFWTLKKPQFPNTLFSSGDFDRPNCPICDQEYSVYKCSFFLQKLFKNDTILSNKSSSSKSFHFRNCSRRLGLSFTQSQ